jgi:hypothetical protein
MIRPTLSNAEHFSASGESHEKDQHENPGISSARIIHRVGTHRNFPAF